MNSIPVLYWLPKIPSLVLHTTVKPLSVHVSAVVEGISGNCLVPFAVGSVILIDGDGVINSSEDDCVIFFLYLMMTKPEPPFPPL